MEFLNKDSNLRNLYAFCLESIYQLLTFNEDMILVTEIKNSLRIWNLELILVVLGTNWAQCWKVWF